MAPSMPKNFIDLYTASNRPNGAFVNVMGVVTDTLAPTMTRGTDMTCTFSLSDSTHGSLSLGEGFKVRFFGKAASELPTIQGTGDVVVLRDMKINVWQGMTLAVSSRGSSWTVIFATSIPTKAPTVPVVMDFSEKRSPRAPALSPPEKLHAINVCNVHDRALYTSTTRKPTLTAPTASMVIAPRDKFALIKDMQTHVNELDQYYDLLGQVIKVYAASGDRVELYITDYTMNKLLWNYNRDDGDLNREGDEFGYLPQRSENNKWPGPWGKHTLTVTLWSPHSFFAQSEVKTGDFVRLRNVHAKWSKDSKIEGICHTDQRYPERIDVTVIKDHETDDQVKDILRRKRDYWKNNKALDSDSNKENRGTKRGNGETEKPLSKTQARKKRKAAKQEAAAKAKDKDSDSATKGPKAITKLPKFDLNPNLRCSHHTTRPRPIASIKSLSHHKWTDPAGTTYTLPFNNINSRATIRIMDFFPPHLEDFAIFVPAQKPEYVILSDDSDTPSSNSTAGEDNPNALPPDSSQDPIAGPSGKGSWQWRFSLNLTDASVSHTNNKDTENDTLTAFVSDTDAEYLLKLDACDLRGKPRALAELREKLFLLWGDLEERRALDSPTKEQAPVGRPFQCCLKEYGVKVRRRGTAAAEVRRHEELQRVEGGEIDTGASDAESEDEESWRWERRWRMWGCTIV